MKTLKNLFIVSAFSALLISGCTNSDTNTSTESSTNAQVDTIPVEHKMSVGKSESMDVAKTGVNKDQSNEAEAKKSAALKSDKHEYILSNVGKKVAADFKGDLLTIAAEEVYIEKKGECGNGGCGKNIILVNNNPNSAIVVTVQISEKNEREKIINKRSYSLNGKQKLKIGCSAVCGEEKIKIKWNIISAVYAQ